jgi:general secretion pathway protein H
VQQPTSPAGHVEPGESGFTLLEVVCVLAIVAMIAALLVPALPRGTSRARLQSYAVATAALLKADRASASRRGYEVVTEVDTAGRTIRSRVTGRTIHVPDDVEFDTLLAARCNGHRTGASINFLSSGLSCGGVITLSRLGNGYQVRVNWLTGGVSIVPLPRA